MIINRIFIYFSSSSQKKYKKLVFYIVFSSSSPRQTLREEQIRVVPTNVHVLETKCIAIENSDIRDILIYIHSFRVLLFSQNIFITAVVASLYTNYTYIVKYDNDAVENCWV